MRQRYADPQLQTIADAFELGAISGSHLFTSGYENSNHYIETPRGRYVTKVFEDPQMRPATIALEAEVMERCALAGIATPRPLRARDGQLVVPFAGKRAIVMEYVAGDNMDGQPLADDLVRTLGEETGKMDALLADVVDTRRTRQQYAFDGKQLLLLEPQLTDVMPALDRALYARLFQRHRALGERLASLATGLIHNDVAQHNVLARDGQLAAILDFSDMAFSPYVQNLAVAMSQVVFTYNWQPHQAGLFVAGYLRHHSLPAGDLALLFDLTVARYLLLIVAFSSWNARAGDDPQRSRFILDNANFLRRFLELGQPAFDALIGL